MKTSSFLLAILISNLSFASYVQAIDTSKYGSLKAFCIVEEKDTRKNCECGQTTADTIMSSKEQAMALALMQGDSKVLSQLGEKHDEFMDKLSQITKGCTKQHHLPKHG